MEKVPIQREECHQRNFKRSIVVAGLLLIAVACASNGKPVAPAQLTEVEATIRSAELAGAFQHAPALLQKSRQALGAAQRALGEGDHWVARDRLLEATTYAEAAQARAQAEQQKTEVTRVRQQADEIERKSETVRKQLRIP